MKLQFRSTQTLTTFLASLLCISVACDSDDNVNPQTDFLSLTSRYYEEDGVGIVTIPFRNQSSNKSLSVRFFGSATEGEDFELVEIVEDGVRVRILDDSEVEDMESVRVQLLSGGVEVAGNNLHTITIVSNCADSENISPGYFTARAFNATEIYAEDDVWGPYSLHFEQDEADPNKYWIDNFFDSGLSAFFVFDPETNSIWFPQQVPNAAFPTRIITSEPVIILNNCSFTVRTHYRGQSWDYEFVRR